MNLIKVSKNLNLRFEKEKTKGGIRNIIFWYDTESEFIDDIDNLKLEDAKILKLSENNCFRVKYIIEKEEPETNFLIYSSGYKPEPRENWLIDIEKYSNSFSTDKVTLIMKDLGVEDENLRPVFKKYVTFFKNKERAGKFVSYNIENYIEEKVHIAALSAICKLPIPDFESVTKILLIEKSKDQDKYMTDIIKFADVDAFWVLVNRKYGYFLEDKNLEQLMIMFLLTDLTSNLVGRIPDSWGKYISPKKADSIIFINHFMNHSVHGEDYDQITNKLEEKLNIKEYINIKDKVESPYWSLEDYLDCDTFKAFDEAIILWLIQCVTENVGEYKRYQKIINKRRTTHWFTKFKDEYETIYFALEFMELKHELQSQIKGSSIYEVIENYTKKYYLFDLFYRKFYLHFDKISNKENFSELALIIENAYKYWYLEELSMKWSGIVSDELKSDIRIDGRVKQQDFYKDYISSYINKGERVFVIISDAFRYEAAKEFTDILNKDIRGRADIDFMQGITPSYTKLGMASLLPHKSIEISDCGDVMVDSISSFGMENRQKIIANYSDEVVAITYKDMIDMKRANYKEKFDGKKLIYIYYDVIDTIGYESMTERDIFKTTQKSFDDLSNLVKNLVNNVSASNIYITAAHGFIYSRSTIEEFNKMSKLEIDKGGASLQETVIPVIKFKNIRKDEYKSTKVEVKLTNISRKITNRITFLELFQKDKVEEKKLSINLKLYFVDDESAVISNENIIIADSRSSKPEDRTYREKFTLTARAYDKNKKYYLIMEDIDDTINPIYEKLPFSIDLANTTDTGF